MLSLTRKTGQGVSFTNLETGETDNFIIVDIGRNGVVISPNHYIPYRMLYTMSYMSIDIDIHFIKKRGNQVSVSILTEEIINIRRSELPCNKYELSAIKGKQV